MKYTLFFLLSILSLNTNSQSFFMEIEGNYTGKNLFIQNPYHETTNGYCTQNISVIQFVIDSGLNTSGIEIRLDTMNFTIGDSIKITFFHLEGCAPKILHENHHPKSTFDVNSISIDTSGLLKWSTKNEDGKLTYTIQHYVWNKWIEIGDAIGNGNSYNNEYEFKVMLHSGENKIRVMQNVSGNPRFSKAVTVLNEEIEKPTLLKHSVSKELEFTREVRYQIYNDFGEILLLGIDKIIDITALPKGHYYLNFDSVETEIIKQ